MKKMLNAILLLGLFVLLCGCSPEKKFVGTWEMDLFDIGNTREAAGDLSKAMYGDFLGGLGSMLASMFSMNAVLEIRENGTLTMSNGGMEFHGNWGLNGDEIVIDGTNISGIATLSDDGSTLYLNNYPDAEDIDLGSGISIKNDPIIFEFRRLEE